MTLLCLSARFFLYCTERQKYNSLNFKNPCVCFAAKHRHGVCGCFRRAEVCLSRKPPKMTTWENYNFQTITWEKKDSELGCFPQTEICITDTQSNFCIPSTKIIQKIAHCNFKESIKPEWLKVLLTFQRDGEWRCCLIEFATNNNSITSI